MLSRILQGVFLPPLMQPVVGTSSSSNANTNTNTKKCKCNSFPISFDCGTFLSIRHHHNLNLNCILKRFQAGSVTAIKGVIILLLLLLLPSPLSHRSGVAVKIQTRPRQLSSLSRHEKWPQLTLSRQRLPKAQKSTKKTSSALRLPRMSTLTFEWRQNRPEQLFRLCAFKSE